MATCKDPSCKKYPVYGYKNGKREYCFDHQLEKMVNVVNKRCIVDDCILKASFGKEWRKQLYCKEHRNKIDPTMEDVISPRCIAAGCTLQPAFNFPGKKPALYCSKDQLEGMIHIKQRNCVTCLEEYGKYITARYGPEGVKPIFCYDHKAQTDINLISKKCETCKKELAIYGLEGGTMQFCRAHMDPNMHIYLVRRRCEYAGCIKLPSFNLKGLSPKFCGDHCDRKTMINVLNKAECATNGCPLFPSYGIIGGKPTYCSDHADKKTMINLVGHKCEYTDDDCPDCPNRAKYNYINLSAKFCKDHRDPKMIDSTARICIDSDNNIKCTKIAYYNTPGNKADYCISHRNHGMLPNPTKRCDHKDCKEIALFGLTTRIHCEDHQVKGEYNLVEQECKSCNCLMVVNLKGICGFCDPTMLKTFRLAKQKKVKEFLDNNNIIYSLYDEIIDTKCHKLRPDFVIDAGTHFVVLEVDENAHKGVSYRGVLQQGKYKNLTCEEARMVNISQALGMKTIFIRYNPDAFNVKGIKNNPTNTTRCKLLIDMIKVMMNKNPENLQFLSVVYLFYDEFIREDIKLLTLLEDETQKHNKKPTKVVPKAETKQPVKTVSNADSKKPVKTEPGNKIKLNTKNRKVVEI